MHNNIRIFFNIIVDFNVWPKGERGASDNEYYHGEVVVADGGQFCKESLNVQVENFRINKGFNLNKFDSFGNKCAL